LGETKIFPIFSGELRKFPRIWENFPNFQKKSKIPKFSEKIPKFSEKKIPKFSEKIPKFWEGVQILGKNLKPFI